VTQATPPIVPAELAFGHLASTYDTEFTETLIGRAQRAAVWKCAEAVFAPSSHLLELNCGTGEDAIHLARLGFVVTACDVSSNMIAEARKKALLEGLSDRIHFYVKATERITEIAAHHSFGGAFSNFSGFNCVKDLGAVARDLAPSLLPYSPLLFCFSTRHCLWESVWYLLHGDRRRAFRRWKGRHHARFGDTVFTVYYPSCREIQESFAPYFRLVSITGIGVAVPPSYVNSFISRHPRLLRALENIDTTIRDLPGLRTLGDHVLLHFERLSA